MERLTDHGQNVLQVLSQLKTQDYFNQQEIVTIVFQGRAFLRFPENDMTGNWWLVWLVLQTVANEYFRWNALYITANR